MNHLVDLVDCKLSDEELIEKIDTLTDEMFEQNKVPIRHVPARPEKDYDLLVGHLIRRFQKLKKDK
jgi:hypothetical protein